MNNATPRLTGVVTERPVRPPEINAGDLRELVTENDRLIERNARLKRERDAALDRVAELTIAARQLEHVANQRHQASPIPRSALSLAQLAAWRRAQAAPFGECVELCPGVIFDADGWRLIQASGQAILLSSNQGLLLRALLRRRGVTVHRDELIAAVWELQTLTHRSRHALHILTVRLRARLRQAGAEGLITTIPGIGLRLKAHQ